MLRRPSFLDKEPPAGYIAGIGRGASGFTTRADVGTGRLARRPDEDDRFEDADEARDQDDEEADAIYNAVEERLRLRHKKRVRVEEQDRGNLGRISSQFMDLKKELGSVSGEQWASLPEVGDLTRRNKRMRDEANKNRLQFAAPDSLIQGVDIGKLTAEREKMLGSRLDASFGLNDNTVDGQDYLNEISSLDTSNEDDMKRIRAILASYTKADPNSGTGWVARARLEEFNKKFDQAKKVIEQGCENCPRDPEVWLESVRLHRVDLKYCKVIIAEGVKFNQKSLVLWLKAAELEQEVFNKRRVVRKALEALPLCEELWLLLVALEDVDKEKILEKALELNPGSETLWLLLISHQEYKEARSTLNRARKALGNDCVTIWLRACRLEFEHGDSSKCVNLVKKAFKECPLTREEWFGHAVTLEEDGLTFLATLIVCELLSSEEHNYDQWLEDSETYKNHVFVMKTILNQIVIHFPKKTGVWRRLVEVYKRHFELEELYKIFENVVELMPKNTLFWLMYSKEVWKNGDIAKAKDVLQRALKTVPSSVDVWCALMKLEMVSGNGEGVDKTFSKAKDAVSSERVWYKYVHILRERGDDARALAMLDEGLNEVSSWKMFLQKSQIWSAQGNLAMARDVLASGVRQLSSVPQLWVALSRVDVQLGNVTRGRSSLDVGLARAPSDTIWLEKLILEKDHGDATQLQSMLSRAQKAFPESSHLWKFQLEHLTKKAQRKTAYQDALQATNNHVRVLLVIGAQFFRDGKLDKAQRWFERSVETDADFGDSYGWLYKTLHKLDTSVEKLEVAVRETEPRHGDVWPLLSKQLRAPQDTVELLKRVADQLM